MSSYESSARLSGHPVFQMSCRMSRVLYKRGLVFESDKWEKESDKLWCSRTILVYLSFLAISKSTNRCHPRTFKAIHSSIPSAVFVNKLISNQNLQTLLIQQSQEKLNRKCPPTIHSIRQFGIASAMTHLELCTESGNEKQRIVNGFQWIQCLFRKIWGFDNWTRGVQWLRAELLFKSNFFYLRQNEISGRTAPVREWLNGGDRRVDFFSGFWSLTEERF
jgi:hypothetical protein